MNTIASWLRPEDVRLDVEIATKNDLFQAIGQHMHSKHGLAPQLVAHCLFRREQAGSTGLGEGVAIPHARIDGLDRIHAVYWRVKPPLAFDAAHRTPVSDVLVLLVPHPAANEHLELLADATRLFSDPDFRQRLHACREPRDVVRLFYDWPDAGQNAGASKA